MPDAVTHRHVPAGSRRPPGRRLAIAGGGWGPAISLRSAGATVWAMQPGTT
jgi:hypothetical protein